MSERHSYQHMYVTYYFLLGKVPQMAPCIQSLHFIHKELKPRVVTLLRITQLHGGKAGTRSPPPLLPHHHYYHHHHPQSFFPQLALINTCAMAYGAGSGAPDNVEDDLGLLPQKQTRQ